MTSTFRVKFVGVRKDHGFLTRSFQLDNRNSVILIGRSSSRRHQNPVQPNAANAYFTCPVVSRRHAEIRLSQDQSGLTIQDLESLHGTQLNGINLATTSPTRLQHGDIINIGGTSLLPDTKVLAVTFQVDVTKIVTPLERKRRDFVDLSSPPPLSLSQSLSQTLIDLTDNAPVKKQTYSVPESDAGDLSSSASIPSDEDNEELKEIGECQQRPPANENLASVIQTVSVPDASENSSHECVSAYESESASEYDVEGETAKVANATKEAESDSEAGSVHLSVKSAGLSTYSDGSDVDEGENVWTPESEKMINDQINGSPPSSPLVQALPAPPMPGYDGSHSNQMRLPSPQPLSDLTTALSQPPPAPIGWLSQEKAWNTAINPWAQPQYTAPFPEGREPHPYFPVFGLSSGPEQDANPMTKLSSSSCAMDTQLPASPGSHTDMADRLLPNAHERMNMLAEFSRIRQERARQQLLANNQPTRATDPAKDTPGAGKPWDAMAIENMVTQAAQKSEPQALKRKAPEMSEVSNHTESNHAPIHAVSTETSKGQSLQADFSLPDDIIEVAPPAKRPRIIEARDFSTPVKRHAELRAQRIVAVKQFAMGAVVGGVTIVGALLMLPQLPT